MAFFLQAITGTQKNDGRQPIGAVFVGDQGRLLTIFHKKISTKIKRVINPRITADIQAIQSLELLDHLEQGCSWSYRIALKDNRCLLGPWRLKQAKPDNHVFYRI